VVWTASRVAHWRATGERPPVAVWTATQTAQFLHAIRGDRLYAAFHLIALRGLRRGEAAGLRWCDVDLDDGVAVISQQLQQYDGHMVTGLGGDPLAPDRLTRHFRALARAAGLPPIRLHDLRHGAATLAQMSGVASDASFCSLRECVRPAAQVTGPGRAPAVVCSRHAA
jgi:integrase